MSHIQDINFEIGEVGQRRALYQFATMYSDPLEAVREYGTNALDEVWPSGWDKPAGGAKIAFLLSRDDNSIMIEDTARGLNEAEVASLPRRVLESAKADKPNKRGEKGVGMLAFGSVGHQMHFISKTALDRTYTALRYSINEDKKEIEKPQLITGITREEMEDHFGGPFNNGTRVIVHVGQQIFRRNLSLEQVTAYLQDTYTPLLVANKVPIYVGTMEKGQKDIRSLVMSKLEGEKIAWMENVPVVYHHKKRNEERRFELSLTLMYDPAKENGKVALHSKDVRVYESIRDLKGDVKDMPLWACPQVHGFINEPHLSLTLGRDGLNKSTHDFRQFVEALQRINDQYWPLIEQKVRQRHQHKANRLVGEVMNLLDHIYQETDPLNKMMRERRENESQDFAEEMSKPRIGPKGKANVKRKRKFPFGVPRIVPFDMQHRNHRSRLELDAADPIILINSEHPDYQKVLGANEPAQIGYLVEVVTPPMAEWEAREAIRQGQFLGDEFGVSAEIIRRSQDLKRKALVK